MSSYRNIRFNFEQEYGEAAKVFIGFAMLVALTLGLFYPYFAYGRYRFAITNTSYGKARLNLSRGQACSTGSTFGRAALLAADRCGLFRRVPPLERLRRSACLGDPRKFSA